MDQNNIEKLLEGFDSSKKTKKSKAGFASLLDRSTTIELKSQNGTVQFHDIPGPNAKPKWILECSDNFDKEFNKRYNGTYVQHYENKSIFFLERDHSCQLRVTPGNWGILTQNHKSVWQTESLVDGETTWESTGSRERIVRAHKIGIHPDRDGAKPRTEQLAPERKPKVPEKKWQLKWTGGVIKLGNVIVTVDGQNDGTPSPELSNKTHFVHEDRGTEVAIKCKSKDGIWCSYAFKKKNVELVRPSLNEDYWYLNSQKDSPPARPAGDMRLTYVPGYTKYLTNRI